MESIILVVCGLVLLGGIGALFMSAAVWRAYQIALVFMLMAAATAFFYLSARTLKTHHAWRGDITKIEAEIDRLTQENEMLSAGGKDGDQIKPGIEQIQRDLNQLVAGRGRVWRQGQPTPLAPNTNTLTVTFEDAVTTAIKPGSVLYAFEDTDVSAGGRYMGALLVTAVADRQLTLEPPAGADEQQLTNLLARPKAAWDLYEIMPADNRDLFADMKAASIQELMPDESEAEFAKDGKPADPKDRPERTWQRLKFLKEYSSVLDNGDKVKFLKDANVKLGAEAVKYAKGQTAVFDAETTAALIKSGDAAEDTITIAFVPGSTGVFDPATSKELIAAGNAELVETVYVRELRDYSVLFTNLTRQQSVHLDSIDRLTLETEAVKTSTAGIETDIALKQTEIAELQADLAHFQSDLKALTSLIDRLDQRHRQVVKELNATFARNQQLASELTSLQNQAVEEANQRTGAPQVSARDPRTPSLQ